MLPAEITAFLRAIEDALAPPYDRYGRVQIPRPGNVVIQQLAVKYVVGGAETLPHQVSLVAAALVKEYNMNPANLAGTHHSFRWSTYPNGGIITHRCDMPKGRFVLAPHRNSKWQIKWEGTVIDTQPTLDAAKAQAERLYMEGKLE